MFDKVQVILDKGKTKAKVLVFYDLTDAFVIMFFGIMGYAFGNMFGELYQLVLCLSFAGVVAFLRFEFPNSFSTYDYIKMGYHYYFKMPKGYVYFPIINESEELIENEVSEEKTITIKHKRKKTKRKGKTLKQKTN